MTEYDDCLKIPKFPCRTFKMPSCEMKLIITDQDVQKAKELHRSDLMTHNYGYLNLFY